MTGLGSTDHLFSTVRMQVRRWRDTDLDALLTVYGDEAAMRWVGDGCPLTHDEAVRWLEVTRKNYETRGYGMFALESASSAELVGFIGIVHPGGQVEAEVKYAFGRDHWGRGLATEALRGLVEYGRTEFGLEHLIATTAPENVASHRVLLKSGFQRGELRDNGDGSFTQVFEWRPS